MRKTKKPAEGKDVQDIELSAREPLAELPVPVEEAAPAQPAPRGLTRDRIDEMRNQLQLLQEFVAKVMIRGEHYGVIPGTSKPTLLKAGAEFLREAYGFEVRSECVDRKFTPAAEAGGEKDYIEFTYRVELLQDGKTVGICEGSCNNYERRYLSLSPFTVLNTIQKMAQKRAYVGAVISATRSSNIFTQDLEDQPELATGRSQKQKQEKEQEQEQISIPVQAEAPNQSSGLRMATPGQSKLVWARLKNELRLNDFAAREFITRVTGKTHSRDLTSADIEQLLDAIDAEGGSADKSAS
jgi:hypothetical protein